MDNDLRSEVEAMRLQMAKQRQTMEQQARLIDRLVNINSGSPSYASRRSGDSACDGPCGYSAAPAPASLRKGPPRPARQNGYSAAPAPASLRKGPPRPARQKSPRRRSPRISPRKRTNSPVVVSPAEYQSPPKKPKATPSPKSRTSKKTKTTPSPISRSPSLTRLSKTPEVQELRKKIVNAMYIFDERLLTGDFWDAANRCFNTEAFGAEATPLVDKLVGEKVEEAGMYWDMAIDVVKRRRRYLLRKIRKKKTAEPAEAAAAEAAEGAATETTGPAEAAATETAEPAEAAATETTEPAEAAATKTPEPFDVDAVTDADAEFMVDSLFNYDAGDSDVNSWQCIGHDCDVEMKSIEDCYPINQRGTSAMLRCLQCWNKDKKLIMDAQANANKYRNDNKEQLTRTKEMQGTPKDKTKKKSNQKQGSRKPAAKKGKPAAKKGKPATKKGKPSSMKDKPAAKKGKPSAKVTVPAKPVKPPRKKKTVKPFAVGDNVLGKWEKDFYQAQIFAISDGKYDLYFPEDGEVVRGAPIEDLKHPKPSENWTKLKRRDYLDTDFMHNDDHQNTPEKKGKFTTRRLGKGPNVNLYICEYVTGRKTQKDNKEYLFDIGYVQRKLFKTFFPIT